MRAHPILRPLVTMLACGVLAGAVLTAAPADQSAATPPPAEAVKTKSLLDYYRAGGIWMHPILFCSIGAVACAVYCAIAISPGKMMPKATHGSMVHFARQRDVSGAFALCESEKSTYGNCVSPALLKINFERDEANKSGMEGAAGEALDREETKQMLWVNYLNVFATIAPMLGLLGTVTGMIEAFDSLAAGKSEPSDLASGIGVAMLTTAGGLLVGIPAMFLYFFFKNRMAAIMSEVQKNVSFIIDVFTGAVTLAEDDARH